MAVRPQPVTDYGYLNQLWTDLLDFIGNPIGVAGLMGNLYAESKCIPYIKQGNTRPPWTPSETYTTKVDTGEISEYTFVHDSIGYGFAQWTYSSRKQGLYDYGSQDLSIGSYSRGLGYMKQELLNGYIDTFRTLVNATTLKEASDYVLHNYEQPQDQSSSAEDYREGVSLTIYNMFADSSFHTVTVIIEGAGNSYAQPTTAVVGTPIYLVAVPDWNEDFLGYVVISGGVTIDPSDYSFLMPDNDVVIQAVFTGETPQPTTLDAKKIVLLKQRDKHFVPNLK